MKLTEPQQTVSDCESRMRILAAGRRFGKSYLAINELAKFARYPNTKCLYVAPSYKMCKQIIWDDLKYMLQDKRWVKRVNESELTIQLVNNSTIMLRSADTPDSIRGIGVDFLVVDEAADIPKLENTWQAVLRPTLSDRQGHALVIGSPKGRNYFYTMWVQGSTQENWSSFQYTTLEGGNVPPEEVETARRELDERTFQAEYEARFVDATTLIYYAFDENNVKSMPKEYFTPRTQLHIGMDHNIDPMSAVVSVIVGDTIWVIDEIEIYGSNTNEMVQEIKQRYPHRQITVYPDASGSAQKTSAAGITDHIILSNAGFDIRVGKTNPPVIDRINSVNSMFKNTLGQSRLFIDPKCRKLQECLLKHSYKPGTRQPEKDGARDYSHLNDALGYLVYRNFALRKEIAEIDRGGRAKRRA